MGEARRRLEKARRSVSEVAGLERPAGKVRVVWDQRVAANDGGLAETCRYEKIRASTF